MIVSESGCSKSLGAPCTKWKAQYIKSRASAPAPLLFAGAEKIGDDVGAFRHRFRLICSMDRAVMWFVKTVRTVVLLLSLWHHGAQGARMLGELPPCKDVWGGIPGWDCFDPPTHDLPPCDFHHQRPGIDCWPKSPPKAQVESTLLRSRDASAHVEGALPPCKDVLGGIQNWDCYDPPAIPLPPCDFKHQSPGIDCSTDSQKPQQAPPTPTAEKGPTDIADLL